MAIVNCPACGQRISSVATKCEHCKTSFDESVDSEKAERDARNARFNKKAKLQNYSFLSMLVFAIGALLMYLGMSQSDPLYQEIGQVMIGLGFVGYIAFRGLIFWMRWQ